MNSDFEDPTRWASDIALFDFDQHLNGMYPIDGACSQALPPPASWAPPGESPSVNPKDLQLAEVSPFGYDSITGMRLPCGPVLSASDGNPLTRNHMLSALDEFLMSQGGWRPPVPCNHCKRLRLQCFMLQTTQANPNPIESCSSCVALYRHCSLAGPVKRQASQFETLRPVIGRLHGVYEDDTTQRSHAGVEGNRRPGFEVQGKSSKRSSSRSNTRTRPLRIWFDAHQEHPYPSESNKENLCLESGLARTQVDNWFSNARRRKKHSEDAASAAALQLHRQGSPMPVSSISHMTPFERWQHSPPEDDPADFTDIERAVGTSPSSSRSDALQRLPMSDHPIVNMSDYCTDTAWLSLPGSLDASSNGTSSCASQQSFATHSTSSKRSHSETSLEVSPRKRYRHSGKRRYDCNNCSRMFTRKSDMLRHEKAIHLQPIERWVCSDLLSQDEPPLIWRISAPAPNCAFCGQTNPDERHFLSHEFIACADRSVSDRTFARKDHLRQHLHKFHKCRKWDGWNLDERIENLRRSGDDERTIISGSRNTSECV